MIHVYPIAEEKQHDLSDTTTCSCEPEVQWDFPEAIVIHKQIHTTNEQDRNRRFQRDDYSSQPEK
jgi:hypothetical protein